MRHKATYHGSQIYCTELYYFSLLSLKYYDVFVLKTAILSLYRIFSLLIMFIYFLLIQNVLQEFHRDAYFHLRTNMKKGNFFTEMQKYLKCLLLFYETFLNQQLITFFEIYLNNLEMSRKPRLSEGENSAPEKRITH